MPISFLKGFYNPEQFWLIGLLNHGKDSSYDLAEPILNGKVMFKRLAIKHKPSFIEMG